MALACNHSTWETEEGEPEVPGYPCLHKNGRAAPCLKHASLHFRMKNLSTQGQNRNLNCPLISLLIGQDMPLFRLCQSFTDLCSQNIHASCCTADALAEATENSGGGMYCNLRVREVETGGSAVLRHPYLHSEFEVNLGHMRPYHKTKARIGR